MGKLINRVLNKKSSFENTSWDSRLLGSSVEKIDKNKRFGLIQKLRCERSNPLEFIFDDEDQKKCHSLIVGQHSEINYFGKVKNSLKDFSSKKIKNLERKFEKLTSKILRHAKDNFDQEITEPRKQTESYSHTYVSGKFIKEDSPEKEDSWSVKDHVW